MANDSLNPGFDFNFALDRHTEIPHDFLTHKVK